MEFEWRYIIVVLLIGVFGLASMYWGAYSSCKDGGGSLRGFILYEQCVGYEKACDVPFLDGISMVGCKNICSKQGGVIVDQGHLYYNSSSNLLNLSALDWLN